MVVGVGVLVIVLGVGWIMAMRSAESTVGVVE